MWVLGKRRRYKGVVVICVKGTNLNLLGIGGGVILGVSVSTRTNRQLDTITFELTTEGDRLRRGGVSVQEVDLFERQTLGLRQDINLLTITRMNQSETNLRNAEVGEQEAPSTGTSPDEEYLDFETSRAGLFVDQVGGGETEDEVPEPVGGDGEGHGLGTDVEREDLTADDPSDGTPCGGEESDVDADEGNQNLLPGDVGGRDRNTNDGDQKLANAHAEGTD